jgi:hypothetical protein
VTVPRCRQALVGPAELAAYMRPAGKLGEYLYASFENVIELVRGFGLNMGETYVLGDSPLVLLSTLRSNFHPDTSSSRFVVRPAPRITDDGTCAERSDGRPIRVYTELDVRLMVHDLYAKLAVAP